MVHDMAILDNLIGTLSQLKVFGKGNIPLLFTNLPIGGIDWNDLTINQWDALTLTQWDTLDVDQPTNSATITFYCDRTHQQPLNAESAVYTASSLSYAPDDAWLNDSPSISQTIAQPLYFVTGDFSDQSQQQKTYRNADNLVFASVLVSSKVNPQFYSNDNTCIIVPQPSKIEHTQANDDRIYVSVAFDLYLQLNIFNWAGLSETNRVKEGMKVTNIIRNALYRDRYRGGNCLLISANKNGTYVGQVEELDGKGIFRGKVKVQCFYLDKAN